VAAVESLVPELAASFGPDIVVSQHGADSHAWDPLAHLAVTTTAHGTAARLVDRIAHRHANGRWLATGGGGYDAYRVVPRTWALTWLAGAHEDVPASTPSAWREQWSTEAARYGQAPLPEAFDDEPNAGFDLGAAQEAAEASSARIAALVRRVLVPRLLREARDRGWWDPVNPATAQPARAFDAESRPVIRADIDAETWAGLTLAPRVIPPAAASDGQAVVLAALRDGAHVAAASRDTVVVAVAVAFDGELIAIGVAPDERRRGLGRSLLAALSPHLERAEITVAERDPFDPMPRSERASIARRLLAGVGLAMSAADRDVGSIDPGAIVGRRR
jgi:ribosomal protein S18 acetylase RimI-like enzyme